MSKFLGSLVVILLMILGYLVVKNQRFTAPWQMPKFGKVTRSDVRVPITASGLISAYQTIQVKSEASGEAITVPVVEGTYVKKDDLLVQLKTLDEERNVARAKSQLDELSARAEQAAVAVETAKINILSAEADVERAEANCVMSKYELEEQETFSKKEMTSSSKQELVNVRARHKINEATLHASQAALENAKNRVQDAQSAVKAAGANVNTAETALADAKERLSKTKIVAKQDCLVTRVTIHKGEMVQSGTGGFSTGTPLLEMADVSAMKVVTRVDAADYGKVMHVAPIAALPDFPGLRENVAAADASDLEHRIGNVTMTVDGFPDEKFEGEIERVEPQGKLYGGSSVIQFDVHVRVKKTEKSAKLPLGTQAQVEFTVESAKDAICVPAEAVKSHEDKKGVWIKADPDPGTHNKFGKKFIPARVGITNGELTQILEWTGPTALKEGDEVYTKLPPEEKDDK